MKTILAAALPLIFLFALGVGGVLPASAADNSPGEVLHVGPVGGGLICNEVPEVRSAVANIETPGYRLPAGCGVLTRPMLATVTVVETFEHSGLQYLIVRFGFASGSALLPSVQYGVWGKPVSTGTPV